MGYNTRFELDLEYYGKDPKPSPDKYEIIDELRKSGENAEYALDEDGGSNGELKWYDHDKDLRSFSKKHPDWMFSLSGEGEDNEDIWKKYFRDGYMQEARAKISYDEYDNSKFLATRRDDKITKVLG